MKKSIGGVAILILIIAVLPLAAQAAPLKKLGWRAEYYDNPGLVGQPKLAIVEDNLNIDYGLEAPALGLPRDFFSARFTDTRHFEKGSYLFILKVDDGARIWLNGELILDAWDISQGIERETKVRIEQEGDYEVQVAYFDLIGPAFINLEILQLGGEDDIVGAWKGEYFLNKDLEGSPVLLRQDSGIRFDWNSGSPAAKVTRDNFSVRWTRSVYLHREGFYIFRIQHDDGMRVYVDGKIIYESWFDQPVTYKVVKIPLLAGYRTFVVEYYEHIGNAVAQVLIDGDPGGYENAAVDWDVGVIVDNRNGRFQWDGPRGNQFVNGTGGYGTDFFWTFSDSLPPVSGRWWAPAGASGNYEVFAYIPGDRATTARARYIIQHFGQRSERIINQNLYYDEFISLGIYYFGGSENEFVSLDNRTGEGSGRTQVAFDAIKFVRR